MSNLYEDYSMKRTWKVLTLSVLISTFSTTASADFIGLKIGAAGWAPEISGSLNSGTDTPIDLTTNLGLDEPTQTSVQVMFEHPVPLFPNVKYQRFELDSTGTSTIGSTFNGIPFSGTINSTLDLTHDDIVLYYEVLDNWVNLDFGLDLKKFDGEVALNDGINNESIIVDETIPLLYLSARFDLPFTGFYIGADINSLSIGDSSVEDSTLMLGYESGSGLGIEGGIKKFSLELDDANNLNTNLEYDGVYLNGFIHF